jgi:hypothetical protein
MRAPPVSSGGVVLMALLLCPAAPGLSLAASRTNPADMAVPMPTAPQAPPAHVESAPPAPGMPLPVPSSRNSGGLPEAGESGNNAVQNSKLTDEADHTSNANGPERPAVPTSPDRPSTPHADVEKSVKP